MMRLIVPFVLGIACQCAWGATSSAVLDEVIVTGERVSRPASATTSSVVVFTGDMLAGAVGADRVEALLPMVPNVQLGSGTEGPSIRGQDSTGVLRDLPAFIGGARPRATLQIDGRAVSFNEFVFSAAPVWDLEQMEVFRTPQTATQGRNSIGGAIFLHTGDPTFSWQSRARLIRGSQDLRQASLMLSGPLLEDRLAFRVAADLRRQHTSSRIGDVFAGADPNRDNYGLVRIKLRGEPVSVPGLQLGATYSHSRVDMPQTVGVSAPFPSRIDPAPGYGVFATNVDSLTLVARQQLSENLVSTTTVSGGDAFVQRFARPGLGETRTDSEDVSLESVLDWSRGPVQLVGGMHLLRSWSSQDINLSAVLGNGQFDDRQGSLGLFSELQVRLWTRLLVTTGIRYQQDVQRRAGAIDGTPVAVSVDFDEAYRAWLPRVSVAFETTPTSRIGVLVQRASNPGGTYFNFDAAEQGQFGPETLWNYELFARLSLADGRVSISANAFLAEGHDSQRAQSFGYAIPGGGTAFWAAIWNVPRTRIHGLETQMSWAVRPRLSLQGSLGLLGTRIIGSASQTDPLLGREFARAPAFTAAAALEWRPAEQWRISLSAHHNGGYFSDDANTAALRIAGTSVVDAQVDYQHGPWSLFAYARNAFDRFYMLSLSSPQRGTAGDPAQYGVGLEWRRVAR